jgi:hypothetical protein
MLYYCPLLLLINYIKNDKEVYLIHLVCGEYVPRCTVRRVKNLAFCKNEEPEQLTN